MTMKLTIKNDDATRTALATSIEISADGQVRNPQAPVELAPGESKEFWIYQGRELKLEEKL